MCTDLSIFSCALQVTGKKVHAAGQWSGAAVSSLLTSKEPVAKEIVASQSKVSFLFSFFFELNTCTMNMIFGFTRLVLELNCFYFM